MAKRKIIQIPDELLRKKCREVEKFDDRLFELLDDMKETLIAADGVGLAAPQVAVLKRVCIIMTDDLFLEAVNPKIIAQSGSQKGIEGCLSVKGRSGEVVRPLQITFEAYDRNGNKYTKTVEGFNARTCCHEFDHLDGVLYIDKCNSKEDENY